jgi:hypothetical protein
MELRRKPFNFVSDEILVILAHLEEFIIITLKLPGQPHKKRQPHEMVSQRHSISRAALSHGGARAYIIK